MDINQFRQKFVEEAIDLLNKLDNDLLILEKDPEEKSKIDAVFRVMHTLKGSSGMFGYEKITEITHELESLYDKVRNGQMDLSSELLDLTFATADHIRNLIGDFDMVNPENIKNQQQLSHEIEFFIKQSGLYKALKGIKPKEKVDGMATWHILFNPDDSIIKRAINLSITFHDLFLLGEYQVHPPLAAGESSYWSIFLVTEKPYDEIEDALLFVMDYCKIQKVADFDIFNEEKLAERDKELAEVEVELQQVQEDEQHHHFSNTIKTTNNSVMSQTTRKITVDASKLDNLMYLVSELVTAKSELMLSSDENYSLKTLEAIEKIDKLSKQFSETTLSIRLVSMQDMMNRFQKLIRDLAKQLNKKVDFVTRGEDTELDKNIIEAIAEPIMHIIRNCIDHGIETPEKRISRGKPEIGQIDFTAFKSGNYVYIDITDDGNGIDTEAVYKKALEKNLIAPGTVLSEKDTHELLFLPGFSTAQSLTDVSGRGVGMDIVLRKIREIRGEINIESIRGKGTSFHIKLQQTISIIDTLLVTSDDSKYAIPMEDVEICGLEYHQEIEDSQSNLLTFNEELIPYVSLRKHLGSFNLAPEKEKLIIINKQDKRYAIVADQIIGEFQAVVKPLGTTFDSVPFLSGASVYGDGSIVLLLDTDKLKNETLIAS